MCTVHMYVQAYLVSLLSLITKVRRQIMTMVDAYPSDTSQGCMSPAMLETIGRFLVLPDIEWVAVKAILRECHMRTFVRAHEPRRDNIS